MGPKKKTTHPVDHGWAWVVLCGGIITYLCSSGVLKSFGIFFVEFLDVYKASVTITSLVSGIEFGVYSIVSLFALTVGLRYLSCRQLVVIGGFFCALGFLMSSFAEGIYFLLLSYSVMFGIGHGLVSAPSLYILGKYFKKKRGIANGLLMSSSSIGTLIFAPLVRTLIDEYSVKGCLLIVSGILMNIVLAGSLMRPPEFFSPKKKQKQPKKKQDKNDSSNGSTTAPLMEKEQTLDSFRPRSNTADSTFSPLARKAMLTRMRSRTESEGVSPKNEMEMIHQEIQKASKVMKSESRFTHAEVSFKPKGGVSKYLSNESLISIAVVEELPGEQNKKHDKVKKDSEQRSKSIFDCNVFHNVSFLLFFPTYCLASVGASIPLIYLPAFATERDIDSKMVAILIVICSVCDTIGRVFCGLISDKLHIAPKYIVLCGLFINSLVHFLTRFYIPLWSLVLYVVVYGIVGGAIYSLYGVILLEMVGLEGYSSALAVITIGQGLMFAASSPIVGGLRDATGTYVSGHLFVATCLFIATAVLTVECIIAKFKRKSTTEKTLANGSTSDLESSSQSDSV